MACLFALTFIVLWNEKRQNDDIAASIQRQLNEAWPTDPRKHHSKISQINIITANKVIRKH